MKKREKEAWLPPHSWGRGTRPVKTQETSASRGDAKIKPAKETARVESVSKVQCRRNSLFTPQQKSNNCLKLHSDKPCAVFLAGELKFWK